MGITGLLIIKPLSAKIKRCFGTTRGLDPFCKIQLGNLVKNAGGKFPTWDDVIVLPRTDENVLMIEVWDCDYVRTHKLIGSAGLSLLHVNNENKVCKTVPIFLGDKLTGEVLLDMEWIPSQSNNDEYNSTNTEETSGVNADEKIEFESVQSIQTAKSLNHSLQVFSQSKVWNPKFEQPRQPRYILEEPELEECI